jgi:hypothetical protein
MVGLIMNILSMKNYAKDSIIFKNTLGEKLVVFIEFKKRSF